MILEGRTRETIFQDRIFWLTFGLSAFFLLPTLWFKFTMDQSLCHYSAWVWKTYHLPPYLGVWDLSFPGIFILHRLILAIFGESIFGFRLFDFLVQLSCGAMIYLLSKRLTGSRPAGFLASVFYSIYYAGLGSLETGEREGYIFWLLLISIILCLRGDRHQWLSTIVSGFLLGFVFLLKPFYGLTWLIFGFWFWYEIKKFGSLGVLKQITVYVFFCLVPSLLVILYYWHLGALKDLLEATIFYNFEVYSGSATANLSQLSSLALFFYVAHKDYVQQSLIIFSSLMMLLFFLFNRKMLQDKKLFWILLSLIVISLISYRLQAKYFPYHLIPALGFLSIFSGTGLAWVAEQIKGPSAEMRDKMVLTIFYFALFLIMLIGVNAQWINFFAFESFKSFDRVYASGASFDAQYYQRAKKLAHLLQKESEIGYFGWHPLVPYLLKKKLPSRFCVVYHLLIRKKNGELSYLQKKWIQEYTEKVIQTKPKFFLVADYVPGWDVFNLKSPSLKQAMHEQFPALENFLQQNYKLYQKDSLLEVYVYYGK